MPSSSWRSPSNSIWLVHWVHTGLKNHKKASLQKRTRAENEQPTQHGRSLDFLWEATGG